MINLILKKIKLRIFCDIFVIFFSFFFGVYLYEPNLNAKLWMIDDHEIVSLSSNGKLKLIDIPSKLINDTEVGNLGKYPRFRPVYYFLRILESYFWGYDTFYWYLIRILICIITFYLFYLTFKLLFNELISALLSIYTFSFFYWRDIYSRLGPGETYASIGFILCIYGFLREMKNKLNIKNFNEILIFIGILLAYGSKEVFVILGFFPIFFILYRYKMKTLKIESLIINLLSLAFLVFISAVVYISLSKTNVDVYGQNVQVTHRINLIKSLIIQRKFYIMLLFSLLLIIGFCFLNLIKNRLFIKKVFITSFFINLFAIYLLTTQYILYNGNWPRNVRYDFPGMIYQIVFIMAVLYLIFGFSNLYFNKNKDLIIQILAILVLLYLINLNSIFKLRDWSLYNSNRTNNFYTQMLTLDQIVKKNVDIGIVLELHSPADFEPTYAIQVYAKELFNIKNKFYYRSYGDVGALNDTALKDHEKIKKIKDNCVSVQFSGVTKTNCRFSVEMPIVID